MNRRRFAAGAAVALVALLLLAGILGTASEGAGMARRPSSYSASPEGLLAFRRLLQRLDLPVQVWRAPWEALPREQPALLIVATPLRRQPDRQERDALEAWIREGGSLLVVDDATLIERQPRLNELLAAADLGARQPLTDLDPATLAPSRPLLADARGTAAVPAGEDLEGLRLHAEGTVDSGSMAVPLALDAAGQVVAAEATLGQGRIVRVMGPLLANDQIAQGHHMEFALRLVDHLRANGPAYIDEYHQGFGGALRGPRGLDQRALGWAMLQACLTAVLHAVSRGRRFGPVRPPHEPPRRSSLEYSRSMAALYRAARAHAHLLGAMLDRLARQARERWGLAAELDPRTLAREIAARSGGDATRVHGSILAAVQAIERPRLGEREMIVRAREIARLEDEVLRGGGAGS